MDVKAVVDLAKRYVADLFSSEGLENVGLEEVDYDDVHETWHVTIGFSRPWDRQVIVGLNTGTRRAYKVVSIDKEGKVLSVKNRETTNA